MKITLTIALPGDMSLDADGTVSRALRQGIIDGLDTPHELSSGMTYGSDKPLNTVYDEGVNLGQAVGRLFGAVPAEEPS